QPQHPVSAAMSKPDRNFFRTKYWDQDMLGGDRCRLAERLPLPVCHTRVQRAKAEWNRRLILNSCKACRFAQKKSSDHPKVASLLAPDPPLEPPYTPNVSMRN